MLTWRNVLQKLRPANQWRKLISRTTMRLSTLSSLLLGGWSQNLLSDFLLINVVILVISTMVSGKLPHSYKLLTMVPLTERYYIFVIEASPVFFFIFEEKTIKLSYIAVVLEMTDYYLETIIHRANNRCNDNYWNLDISGWFYVAIVFNKLLRQSMRG